MRGALSLLLIASFATEPVVYGPGIPGVSIARADYANYDEARDAARTNAEAGRYTAARQDLKTAIALAKDPGQVSAALLRIGETYKLEKKPEEARTAWSEVLALKGAPADDRWGAQMAIGSSFLDENQPVRARTEFRSIENNKEYQLDATSRIFLGLAIGITYQHENQFAMARSEFEKVLATHYTGPMAAPALQTVRMSHASTYLGEADYPQARAEFEKIAAATPDQELPPEEQESIRLIDLQARLEVGYSYQAEKQYKEARIQYRQVFDDEKTPPNVKADAEDHLRELDDLEKTPPNKSRSK